MKTRLRATTVRLGRIELRSYQVTKFHLCVLTLIVHAFGKPVKFHPLISPVFKSETADPRDLGISSIFCLKYSIGRNSLNSVLQAKDLIFR